MKIRKAEKGDITFLFDLRNDPEVRQASFRTEPLDTEAHKEWFNKKLSDPNTSILIAEDDNAKIAQIRFELDRKMSVAEVSIAVVRACRGKGYGTKILAMGCTYIFRNFGIKKIIGHIKTENKVSINTFSGAGFVNYGHVKYLNHDCIQMCLEKK